MNLEKVKNALFMLLFLLGVIAAFVGLLLSIFFMIWLLWECGIAGDSFSYGYSLGPIEYRWSCGT